MARDRRAIYERDRETENANSRAYYAANRDRLRAKMRERSARKRVELRDYKKAWVAADRLKNKLKYLHRACRLRARERGLEFTISVADLAIPNVCPVLGIPIIISSQRPAPPNSPSVDRIDNSRGYVPGNVRVISYRANSLKSDATIEEARLLVANWFAR